MARDLLGRPPLRVSELPPNLVSLPPGEPRLIQCPGCSRWQKPHDGGLRRHTTDIDTSQVCPESGRRVWFDLTPAEWLARVDVAGREAALRRAIPVRRKTSPPPPPPVFRLAASR